MLRPAQSAAAKDPASLDPAGGGGSSPRALAINYHFVRPRSSGRFALRAHERPDRFDQQLSQLAREFRFGRLRDLLVEAQPEAAPPRVVLTFDDGARDFVCHALPLLERYGATASVFVCAQPYLEGRLFRRSSS